MNGKKRDYRKPTRRQKSLGTLLQTHIIIQHIHLQFPTRDFGTMRSLLAVMSFSRSTAATSCAAWYGYQIGTSRILNSGWKTESMSITVKRESGENERTLSHIRLGAHSWVTSSHFSWRTRHLHPIAARSLLIFQLALLTKTVVLTPKERKACALLTLSGILPLRLELRRDDRT